MKKLIILTGISSIILISLGAFAKAMHWPGAAIALTLGIFILVFVFTPNALLNNHKNAAKKSKFFYWSVFLTVALLFISALFKILHWPGAGVLLIIGTLFPFVVLIPALLFYSKKNKSFTMSNLIVVLLFLAYSGVTSTFLALNISKDMIDEAITVQKEMKNLNDLTHELNKEFANQHAKSIIISNAATAKKELDDLSEKLLKFPDNKNIAGQIENPEKIPFKDNYSIAASIISHQNEDLTQSAFKLSNYNKTLSKVQFLNSNPPVKPEDCKNNLINRAGDNPKIWAIANLTAMKSQIEIQEHLYLKDKILKTPPE